MSYTLYDSETQLDSVISFNSHHTLHKRQSGSGNDSTTASPSQTSTPEYTEKEVRPCQKVAPHKNDTTFVTFNPVHTEQKVRRCQKVVSNINQNVEECHTKKQIYLYGTMKPL